MRLQILAMAAVLVGSFVGSVRPMDAKNIFSPQEKEAADLSGVYDLLGYVHEEPYSGIVIIKKQGDGYRVQYTAAIGSNTLGIGVQDGDRFTVSWSQGHLMGISIYTHKSKNLKGRWMMMPNFNWHEEELIFVREFPVPKEKKET